MKTKTSLLAVALLLGAAVQPLVADSLSISERSGAKVVCVREEGETFCDTVATGSFKARGTKNWEGVVDITNIDENTDISVAVGNLSFDFALREDPTYVPGKRSATFVTGHLNENDKFIKDMVVKVHWNAKQVSISIATKVSDEQGTVLADNYSGEDGAFVDSQEFGISFAGLFLTVPVNITGQTTHKIVTKGRGDNAEEFEITTVSLTGKPGAM